LEKIPVSKNIRKEIMDTINVNLSNIQTPFAYNRTQYSIMHIREY